ncbi:MAG TPA: peptidylprolyl isomerase [Burkholderiaceae bacterium]
MSVKNTRHVISTPRARAAMSLALLAVLAACGGNGDATPTATISQTTVTATRFGGTALVTIQGTGLDSTLVVSSQNCSGMTMLNTAPYVSSTTTAYYQCTVDGGIQGNVVASSNGVVVGQGGFTVPQPIVTMAVGNGLAVSGNIVFSLRADVAPKTVANFLHYVNTGFYNNTIFHRVVPGFVVQGGGYGPTVGGHLPAAKTTDTSIGLESSGLSNVQWSIAMANDGGSPPMANSQFFVNLADNTGLDGGYTVFGTVSAGTDVVTAITNAPATCTANPAASTTDCLPQPDVLVSSATQTQ